MRTGGAHTERISLDVKFYSLTSPQKQAKRASSITQPKKGLQSAYTPFYSQPVQKIEKK